MLPRLFIRQLNSFSFFSSPSFYRTFSSFSSSHFSSPLLSSSSSLSSPSSPSSPASDTSTGLRELEGLLVVSIEQAVAAPLCSSRLCDDGARVLKIERPPKGDFARYYDRFIDNRDCSYFVWLNRGKESVAIDLKNNKQKDELIKIIEKADIFIQNLAPGQTEKMGLGSQMLRERFPRLITCDISGYGEGPYHDYKAYDLLLQAETGLCAVTGTSEPSRVGISICDIAAGLNAYSAILRALLYRHRTGKGCSLSVSLFSAIAELMSVPYLTYKYGKIQPKRMGIAHPTVCPYGAFPCADGSIVVFSVQNDHEFISFAKNVLNEADLPLDPRYKDNSARLANRALVDNHVASIIAKHTKESISKLLFDNDIAFAFLNDLSGLTLHPHLRTAMIERDNGEQMEVVAPPVSVNGVVQTKLGRIPKIGEHTEKILTEFGLK